jgi:hypothetical protein
MIRGVVGFCVVKILKFEAVQDFIPCLYHLKNLTHQYRIHPSNLISSGNKEKFSPLIILVIKHLHAEIDW